MQNSSKNESKTPPQDAASPTAKINKLEAVLSDKELLNYFKPSIKPYWKILLGAIFFMCIVAISEGMIPKLVKDLLDKSFNANQYPFWYMPALITGLAVVRSIAQFFSQYLMNYAKQNILANSRGDMFDRLIHAPIKELSHYQASDLINTIMFEWQQALEWLAEVLTTLVRDSLTVIVLMSYLFYLNWQLACIIIVILPMIAWATKQLKRRVKKLSQLNYSFLQQSAYQVEQIFKGLKMVKAYQAENFESTAFARLNLGLKQSFIKMSVAAGLNQPITQILASVALAVVLMIAIWQAQYQGQSIGAFTAFIMSMMLLISPLKRLSDVNQPLTRGLLALGRVHRVLTLPPEKNQSLTKDKALEQPSFLMSRPNLAIKNLSIRFGEQAVIDQLSLNIPYAKKIAIVGGSGAGKTSLIQAILHFVDFQGEIILKDESSFDSKNHSTQDLTEIRSHIAYVSQDSTLFNRSILENMTYQSFTQEQQNQAAFEPVYQKAIDILKQVQLYDWFEQLAINQANVSIQYNSQNSSDIKNDILKNTLKSALNYVIGDNGNQLSGGQRQRLAFARALYKQAPILILDEATSALDAKTQQAMTQMVLSLPQTVIAIAHRLHAVQAFDEIIVLDQGRITERGSHDDLLAQNALYARLWASQ
jgi:ATP-binding cassette, subfamily B, bacterial MsbA